MHASRAAAEPEHSIAASTPRPAGQLAHGFDDVERRRVERRLDAEGLGDRPTPGVRFGDDDRRRPAGDGVLGAEHADRPGAGDENGAARTHPGAIDAACGHGDRFDERALLVVELVGDAGQLTGGHDGRFGEATPSVAQPGARHRGAQVVLAEPAVVAVPAVDQRHHRHSVAGLDVGDTITDFEDLGGELVAEHLRVRRPRQGVGVDGRDDRAVGVLVDVGTADPAPQRGDEHLAVAPVPTVPRRPRRAHRGDRGRRLPSSSCRPQTAAASRLASRKPSVGHDPSFGWSAERPQAGDRAVDVGGADEQNRWLVRIEAGSAIECKTSSRQRDAGETEAPAKADVVRRRCHCAGPSRPSSTMSARQWSISAPTSWPCTCACLTIPLLVVANRRQSIAAG